MNRIDLRSDRRTNAKLKAQANEGNYVRLQAWTPALDATPDNVPFAGEDEEWKLRECRLERKEV